jgi:hypothetical protein
MVWKAFLSELDREMQQYQIYRARQHTHNSHNQQGNPAYYSESNWNMVSQIDDSSLWPSETQRRSM